MSNMKYLQARRQKETARKNRQQQKSERRANKGPEPGVDMLATDSSPASGVAVESTSPDAQP